MHIQKQQLDMHAAVFVYANNMAYSIDIMTIVRIQ